MSSAAVGEPVQRVVCVLCVYMCVYAVCVNGLQPLLTDILEEIQERCSMALSYAMQCGLISCGRLAAVTDQRMLAQFMELHFCVQSVCCRYKLL